MQAASLQRPAMWIFAWRDERGNPILGSETHSTVAAKTGGLTVMARALFVLMVLLSVIWAPGLGFSESVPMIAVSPAKTPADAPSSIPNDKAAQISKDVKDVSVPPQVMEKLSNAVSSEYI